jgi:hypothetical protein
LPVPSKKKPNPADQVVLPPDPREAIAPTAASLRATLVELEKVLAEVPLPPPPPPSVPAPPPPPPPVAPPAPAGEGAVSVGVPAAQQAVAPKVPEPVWPPQLDLVEALLHIYFADGLPCGYGQEARRRIQDNFVDRNEFRVTEAFEVEDMLRDLQIPGLFDRCLAVRDSIAQIYNDQNGVNLGFLRDAGISDRNTFFQRVPAVQPHVVTFLTNMLTFEELCFSDKSTLRAQQRLGLDAKDAAVNDFLNSLRAMLKPYGQLPLSVGPHLSSRKPNLQHVLSPACVLIRLAPAGKKRS